VMCCRKFATTLQYFKFAAQDASNYDFVKLVLIRGKWYNNNVIAW
jgi:hypothetical protein